MSASKRWTSLGTALAAALWLAGCGGGGGDAAAQAADPLLQVPASANQSEAGTIDYLGGVIRSSTAESRDPVSLLNFMPPASDDTEPVPVGG
jgi:hypothetical protein